MKTMLRTLLAGCTVWAGCLQAAAQQPIKIDGTIEGVEKGRLLLVVATGENQADTIARTDFNTPHFTLEATLDEPMGATILLNKYEGGFFFFAEPGKTYTAHLANGQGAYIRGGELQDAWLGYLDDIRQVELTRDSLQKVFEDFRAQSKFRSASEANARLQAFEKESSSRINQFLASHDDILPAYVAYMYATQQTLDATGSKQRYEALGTNARQSAYGRMLAQRVARLEAATSGKPAPDFTLNDLEGKPVTLSQVKSRLKIVDFWASWCGPCRLNNPRVKALYEAYKDKGLEIIGVSLDTDTKRWKEAVEKDGLPWIQVSSLKGWKCPVASLYGVSMVPSLFVIDASNRIIATDLKGDALNEFVAGILDK